MKWGRERLALLCEIFHKPSSEIFHKVHPRGGRRQVLRPDPGPLPHALSRRPAGPHTPQVPQSQWSPGRPRQGSPEPGALPAQAQHAVEIAGALLDVRYSNATPRRLQSSTAAWVYGQVSLPKMVTMSASAIPERRGIVAPRGDAGKITTSSQMTFRCRRREPCAKVGVDRHGLLCVVVKRTRTVLAAATSRSVATSTRS